VRPLFALALGAILTGCTPGWTCLNRPMVIGRWAITCRFVNGDRSCSGARTGTDYALIMINHEEQHAREYGLFVTDKRATADNGGNALFQVLSASADPTHPGLPTLSDYVSAGASKDGVLTVALRKDDIDALAAGDGFHLTYTRTGAASPTIDMTATGMADVAGTVERMSGCLDLPR
jgi:hypothetical protein